MGSKWIFLQCALCIAVAQGQFNNPAFQALPAADIFRTSEPSASSETFRGLTPSQINYVQRESRLQGPRSGGLTEDERRSVQTQEDFRRAVAESNRQRIQAAQFENRQQEPQRTPAKQAVRARPAVRAEGGSHFPAPENTFRPVVVQPEPAVQAPAFNPLDTATRTEAASQENRQRPRVRTQPKPFLDFDDVDQKEASEEEEFQKQAKNARYTFQSSVSDTINDNSHIRQETRDGLKLKGLYSYSDGFFKRTVEYVADENGYRVVKEESEPIGNGPIFNPTGKVDVSTNFGGNSLKYSLTASDMPPLDTRDIREFVRSNFDQ